MPTVSTAGPRACAEATSCANTKSPRGRHSPPTPSLLALAAALAGSPALAQERTDPSATARIVVVGERDALTVPDTDAARSGIERTPGGVALVPDTEFKRGPALNVRDILAFVPGVVTQHRMGDDARISIRGSGLSRAYGSRGVTLLLDGVPMNTSDGLIDLFEVDPSAYRYAEVFKGANALRYGANSLGGAINLVTPTGYDAPAFDGRLDIGSFGYLKGQASTGGVSGALDYFATASAQTIDGYREHSEGTALRANGNLGYRLSPDLETRFYVTAASTEQQIPGEIGKDQARAAPHSANPEWVRQDQQRNVDSVRIANKTAWRHGPTRLEFGGFYNARHVDHPIFQYLDYTVDDYGAFARAVDERALGTLRNRLVLGATLHNGTLDTEQFVNLAGAVKGALVSSYVDRSANLSLYAEDSLTLRSGLTLVAGLQYLHARRERHDRFLGNGDQSGTREFDIWSPKLGVLADLAAEWQVFANVSRSGEVPSFDVNSFASPAASNLDAQRQTSVEAGTRGRLGGLAFDLSLYRAEIEGELQCLTTGPFSACSPINAERTVHQGLEAGLDWSVLRSAFGAGDNLAVQAAYTYNDFRFDADARYGDNSLPGVPEHLLRAELLYTHPAGFYAGPNLEWSPEPYFADNANTLSVDPYALLGARIGYDTGSGLSVYLEGRNLADRAYISTVAIAGTATPTDELFNPGTGRAVFGGIRGRF
jgi:iron complex outermembrane receptor protein